MTYYAYCIGHGLLNWSAATLKATFSQTPERAHPFTNKHLIAEVLKRLNNHRQPEEELLQCIILEAETLTPAATNSVVVSDRRLLVLKREQKVATKFLSQPSPSMRADLDRFLQKLKENS